ncbi:hypothetical protein ACLOJK_032532 [Asimina triloba]
MITQLMENKEITAEESDSLLGSFTFRIKLLKFRNKITPVAYSLEAEVSSSCRRILESQNIRQCNVFDMNRSHEQFAIEKRSAALMTVPSTRRISMFMLVLMVGGRTGPVAVPGLITTTYSPFSSENSHAALSANVLDKGYQIWQTKKLQ